MLIDAKQLLIQAKRDQRALPAFNVSSIEALQAIFEAAGEQQSPVIIETSKGETEYLTPELLTVICKKLSKICRVDYALHLDRGNDLQLMKRCLQAGYNSISAEFGEIDYQKNVELTKKVRQLTNAFAAQLEGVMEVVPLRYYQDKLQTNTHITQPKIAEQFVADTNADSLVVSIGTQSGNFKTLDNLRFDVLKELNGLLPAIPFVLHGGSFLSKKICEQAIKLGIAKINVNTELRLAYTNMLKNNLLDKPEEYAPYRLLKGVKRTIKDVAREKIKLFKNNSKKTIK